MKRAIKFRGKSLYDKYPKANGGFEIPQGAFVYGNLVVDMNGNPQIDIQGYIDGNSFHHTLWVDEDTVGQFTGLIDRNGKEIYEDDIIRFKYEDYSEYNYNGYHHPVEVISAVTFEWGGYRIDGYPCWLGACCDWAEDECEFEVIGNIYDNPELLEGGSR